MDVLTDIFGVQVKYESWNKRSALPMYIAGSYDFTVAILNGCRCIMLSPTEELVTIPALKKQIKRIQEIENIPVVIKLPAISLYKRKKMIESGISSYYRIRNYLYNFLVLFYLYVYNIYEEKIFIFLRHLYDELVSNDV